MSRAEGVGPGVADVGEADASVAGRGLRDCAPRLNQPLSRIALLSSRCRENMTCTRQTKPSVIDPPGLISPCRESYRNSEFNFNLSGNQFYYAYYDSEKQAWW